MESHLVGITCTEDTHRGLIRSAVYARIEGQAVTGGTKGFQVPSHPPRGHAEGGRKPPRVVEVGQAAGAERGGF